MNNVLKINFGKRKRRAGVLGLTLDGSRLEGVVLRRGRPPQAVPALTNMLKRG